jgi:hypothetical protein
VFSRNSAGLELGKRIPEINPAVEQNCYAVALSQLDFATSSYKIVSNFPEGDVVK